MQDVKEWLKTSKNGIKKHLNDTKKGDNNTLTE